MSLRSFIVFLVFLAGRQRAWADEFQRAGVALHDCDSLRMARERQCEIMKAKINDALDPHLDYRSVADQQKILKDLPTLKDQVLLAADKCVDVALQNSSEQVKAYNARMQITLDVMAKKALSAERNALGQSGQGIFAEDLVEVSEQSRKDLSAYVKELEQRCLVSGIPMLRAHRELTEAAKNLSSCKLDRGQLQGIAKVDSKLQLQMILFNRSLEQDVVGGGSMGMSITGYVERLNQAAAKCSELISTAKQVMWGQMTVEKYGHGIKGKWGVSPPAEKDETGKSVDHPVATKGSDVKPVAQESAKKNELISAAAPMQKRLTNEQIKARIRQDPLLWWVPGIPRGRSELGVGLMDINGKQDEAK